MNQDLREVPVGESADGGLSSPALGEEASAILAHACANPQKIAVRDSRTELTWRELTGSVSVLAHRLEKDGVGVGSPVLLLADTCVETVIVYWALRSLSAVIIIADPGCTRHEFEHYVATTQPGCVFSTRDGTWERLGLDAQDADSTPSMTWYVQNHDTGNGGLRPWLSRSTEGPARIDRFSEARSARLVLFSSGTTGNPKAIVHTDASIGALNRLHADVWGLTTDDVVLGSLPFHTIYGSIYTAASTIYNGATLALMERFKPEIALHRIDAWGVTTAAMVPTMLTMMLNVENRERFDLSSLRAIYVGAAPISEAVIEDFAAFADIPVLGSYGLTECPGAAVERSDGPHVSRSAGRICAGFEVAVRDPEGNSLPVGETGEVTLRGPSSMLGYLGQPDLTSQRIRDGWVYTQDIGHVDHLGNVFLYGRATDMIIRGGLNIAPKEIEDVLIRHPGVISATVVGVDDPIYGQVVKAFVAPRVTDDLNALAEKLRLHCRARLNRAKVPEDIAFVRDFPMNAGGKVLRHELTGPGIESRLLTSDTLRSPGVRRRTESPKQEPSPASKVR